MVNIDIREFPDNVWEKVRKYAEERKITMKKALIEIINNMSQLNSDGADILLDNKFRKYIENLAKKYNISFRETLHLLLLMGIANEGEFAKVLNWYRIGKDVGKLGCGRA